MELCEKWYPTTAGRQAGRRYIYPEMAAATLEKGRNAKAEEE